MSGGEPILQYMDSLAILMECKKLGINTAMETSCYCSPEIFRLFVGLVDHLLIDIKLMDAKRHWTMTGVENTQIQRNIAFAAGAFPHIVVRYPYIPGYTDMEEDAIIARTVQLDIPQIDVLPYHLLGIHKYADIGLPYHIPTVEWNQDACMERFTRKAQAKGLTVCVGG